MGMVSSGEFSHFCELPDDLTEEILAWLPVDYLSKFSNVCQQWKALFSSTRFITTQWLETPPNKNPLMLVGAVDYYRECLAYSFFTQSWKSCRLSHSFIEEKEYPPSSYRPVYPVFNYIASGAGLFLIGGYFTNSIYVCNPFTGKCFTLRKLRYRIHYLNGEVGIVPEGENGYKVVVVYAPTRQAIVDIYDSKSKVWKTAGVFPDNLIFFRPQGLLFSGGRFFYSLAWLEDVKGILKFNMRDDTYIFVPLPRRTDIFSSYLVKCGSRILLVSEVEKELGFNDEGALEQGKDVVIWEFMYGPVEQWKLISMMPRTIFPGRLLVSEALPILRYTGIGNCLYVRVQGGGWKEEVAVYNLTHNSWSMLPETYFPINEITDHTPFFGFTPRPDMQVD